MKHYHLDNYYYDLDQQILFLRGWVLLKECQISIVVDKKEVLREDTNEYRMDICDKYTSQKDSTNYGFEYTLKLDAPAKKIQIYAISTGKKYKLFSTKIPTTALEKKWVKMKNVSKKCLQVLWKKNLQLLNPFLIRRYICTILENKEFQKEAEEYVNPNNFFQYRTWALEKAKRSQEPYQEFSYQPLISILVPVYNVPIVYLKACIDSVLAQTYPNFELCLADDCSTDPKIREVLEAYQKQDSRIKVVYRKENGHISRATNSALEVAKGEFISLLDNDDVITEDALFQVVKALNENSKLDLIYSDEDKLDLNGHLCHPAYKPDWSPEMFHCYNYFCHFTTIRKKIMDKVNGFRVGYEGAQDYDLFLRVVSIIKPDHIYHIPKVLYHWRMIAGSTAAVMDNKSYAFDRGKKALQDYFDAKKIPCKVDRVTDLPYYYPDYQIPPDEKITVMIKGSGVRLKNCIHRLQKFTDYKQLEIFTSEMGSWAELIKKAKGKYILLMDENVLFTKEASIQELVKFASQAHIGLVSPSLKKKNSYMKSSGVVLFPDHYKPVLYSTRQRTTAIEPKLNIPVNYLVPGTKVLLFSKEKYLKVNVKQKRKEFPTVIDIIQLGIQFYKAGFYNVTDAPNEFLYDGLLEETFEEEKYQKLHVKSDPFYNPNYSKTYLYQLDKFEEEEKDER